MATKSYETKPEEAKEVVLRGAPQGGLSVASGDGFGANSFSAQEVGATIKDGVALQPTPVRPVGKTLSRHPQPQLLRTCSFFSNRLYIERYSRGFGNIERFNFPNEGDWMGVEAVPVSYGPREGLPSHIESPIRP